MEIGDFNGIQRDYDPRHGRVFQVFPEKPKRAPQLSKNLWQLQT